MQKFVAQRPEILLKRVTFFFLKNYSYATMVTEAKKMKITTDNGETVSNQPIKIGTHDGVFHCDESLACFLIKQLPRYKDATIIRSRDRSVLDTCDIVVDVGEVFDPKKLRFDHHQKSFNCTIKDFFPDKQKLGDIKLSSAGLIYAHYGHEILAGMLDWKKDDTRTDIVFDMVYETFIKEIDAIDNGINMFDAEPRYRINTHLSARVGSLKPHWNESHEPEILYERFMRAMELTGKEFTESVQYYGNVWMPARVLVEEAFKKRFEIDASGRIVVLDAGGLPWIQHLFQVEEKYSAQGQIAFVLFPDNGWRVRAVPISPQSFELRNGLESSWRGLRTDEIIEKSQIEGCVFVHSTGFIGGNKTLDGALEMARKSLKPTPSSNP